jgi:hypothetical protein
MSWKMFKIRVKSDLTGILEIVYNDRTRFGAKEACCRDVYKQTNLLKEYN